VYFHPENAPGLKTPESLFEVKTSLPYLFSTILSIFPLKSGTFGNNCPNEKMGSSSKRKRAIFFVATGAWLKSEHQR